MFGRRKSNKIEIRTTIGDGVSSRDPKYGEVIEVRRYHRGAVIDFSWPSSHPAAQQVPEISATIQTYIDRALDMIDAHEGLRTEVVQYGGIYPMNVDWGRDDCDFSLAFAYAGWDDGILRFFFRDGKIVDTDVSD